MKTSNHPFIGTIGHSLFLIGFLFVFAACNEAPKKEDTSKTQTAEIAKVDNVYWNVKAIHPEGQSLDVKAFDAEGKSFDIKAIQNSDQDSFLDVKCIVDRQPLPVKMLESANQFVPVAAINNDGAK
ncbi:MAG: hypothetical protein KJO52_11730, partial [Maribacter sp.]|nr:hypothetical protein [Maribacter sp.]